METAKYVYWQDGDVWLGYLEEYPDYRSQGATLEELKDNLKALYNDMISCDIPCIRKHDVMEVA